MSERWDHTAGLACILINANRAKGKPPVSWEEIHPFKDRTPAKGLSWSKENMGAIKQFFVDRGAIVRRVKGKKK